jgi:hypothetical protein
VEKINEYKIFIGKPLGKYRVMKLDGRITLNWITGKYCEDHMSM